ncbi:MAG: class I SAM-dependent methyltransferase [Enterobacterales bacterium]|nr:class I SAM-dependent methyltransferase [Enterobacterales bacterium]
MSDAFDNKAHWELVYRRQPESAYSWYQAIPKQSLDLIMGTNLPLSCRILDVGGGDSNLVDGLLESGYQHIDILDISTDALNKSKARLGVNTQGVNWLETDITKFVADKPYDLWHDRAVFHFLTTAESRARYKQVLGQSLRKGGHLILATFAMGGPEKCSGLDIVQYDAELMVQELGDDFVIQKSLSYRHITPAGVPQLFNYFWFVHA